MGQSLPVILYISATGVIEQRWAKVTLKVTSIQRKVLKFSKLKYIIFQKVTLIQRKTLVLSKSYFFIE
jgi:hypothetical protein